jgi:O-antigen/teichoic acid export membrane protein
METGHRTKAEVPDDDEVLRAVKGFVKAPALRERLLSGGAWALAGRVGVVLSQLAVNALLARLLSPQDLGAYFLAFSVISFGSVAGWLGLDQAGVRFVAESLGLGEYRRARRTVGKVVRFGLLGTSGVGLAYLLVGGLIGERLFHSPTLVAVTGLVAAWMVVTSLQSLLAATFRGFHDIRLATVFGASVSGLGLLPGALMVLSLGIVLLFEGSTSLALVLLLAILSGLTSALTAGWMLHRKTAALPARGENDVRSSEILQVAWPLLVTNLTLFAITQVDIWILGAFRPPEEVAVYGAAARVVLLVAMPLQIMNAVVPPLIAEMYAQGRMRALERTLRPMATLAGIPALLVLLGFVLLGGPLLGLVYGGYYSAGATVLVLLSVGQLVSVWVGSCALTLAMTGHQSLLMGITVCCGVATVVAGLSLVGRYGSEGVAAAAAGGLALQNILLWLAARYAIGIWTHLGFAALPGFIRSVVARDV